MEEVKEMQGGSELEGNLLSQDAGGVEMKVNNVSKYNSQTLIP